MYSQEETPKDSILYKQKYGLRLGVDLSKPIRAGFDEDYKGLELVGDYRITKRFFVAGEIGREEKTTDEDLFNFTTKGTYIKAGFDYNAYENWYGMQNSIHIGLRYAISSFSQTLNSFNINNRDHFFNEGDLIGDNPDLLREFDGLNAQWIEAVFGIKAELFNNLYLGASIRLNYLVNDKAPEFFPNLWIPGFNKKNDSSRFGIGYNYTLTYFIPLYKKK